jgi:O-antigen/teichoic acid export membrane protein
MLAKYGSIQLLGRFLPGLIGFFVASVLTRLLPPDQYGVFGLATAVAQIVALSAFGWLGLSVTRLAAGRKTGPHFAGSVLAIFGAVATTILVGGAAVMLLPVTPDTARLAAATAFGCIAFAYFDLRSAFYAAALKFFPLLALNLARAFIVGVATILAARFFGSGFIAFVAACGALAAVCLFWSRRSEFGAFAFSWATVNEIAAFGLPIAGSLVLFAAASWTDRVVLGVEAGAAAVGLFTAAAFVIQNTLQFAAQAIGSAAYPLAVLAYESKDRWVCDRQLEQNLVVLFGFLLPAAIGLSLLAPNIAGILVGRPYREAVTNLTPLLAAAALISGLRGNFVDHSFQLAGTTWHYMAISANMMVVNLAALLCLVPRYGYMGAGFAALVTAIAGLAHALLVARRVYRLPFPRRELAKVLAAAMTMALVLSALLRFRGTAALALQIAIGFGVYAAIVYALNLLNMRAAMAGLLPNRRGLR